MEQTAATQIEVGLDEAMSIAVRLQRSGRLEEAEKVYRLILEQKADHPGALHYSGVLAHQQGRSDEAVALIRRALELEPDRADSYSNLGIILRSLGRVDEAIDACRRAIAIDPGHANAHNNLGGLLRMQGKGVEAEAAYREAIRLDPEHTDAWVNLGNLLTGQRRIQESVVCFCKVITLNPKHVEGRRRLAFAHTILGELDKAVEIFRTWLDEEPESPVARHMLAACSGRDVPQRASDQYVEDVFDGFAASFESRLAALSYRAPSLVAAMLGGAGGAPAKDLDVLDAGCGTGLCGALIAPYARRLVGVDLSGGMLAQAEEKKVYDELVKEELTGYVRARPGSFDAIVSADTLVYFGALDDIVAAAAAALRPRGVIVFTLEELVDGDVDADFCIRPHGRYNHRRTYVERLLAAAGLRAHVARADLRMEGGVPVAGLVVRAEKPAGEHDA